MKEIIRHGVLADKIKDIKEFTCPTCGCVFKCDSEDYTITSQRHVVFAYSCCPECDTTCYKELER